MRDLSNSFRLLAVGAALLCAGILSSCSLQQKGSSDSARLILKRGNSSRSLASSARISGMDGLPPADSNTYFMIAVSGEGMPLAPVDGAQCLGLTVPSTVFVPATVTGTQEIELEVLVGRNRLVRLYQLQFSGSAPKPNSGEAIHRYLDRTRSSGSAEDRVEGEPLLLATAFIPNLQGDQSVTLVEKSMPELVSCPGQGEGWVGPPPGIYDSNQYAQMTDYSHWEGGTQQSPNPIRVWSWTHSTSTPFEDFHLRLEGRVRNHLSGYSMVLDTSSSSPVAMGYYAGIPTPSPTPSSTPAPFTLGGEGLMSPGPTTGSAGFGYNQSAYFRQLAVMSKDKLSPTASWFGGTLRAKQHVKFWFNSTPSATQGSLYREVPFERVSGRPIWVSSATSAPVSNSGATYQNLYKIKIRNDALSDSLDPSSSPAPIKIMPFHGRSLFTDRQWKAPAVGTTPPPVADVEIIPASKVGMPTSSECPFLQLPGDSVSELRLEPSQECNLYFAVLHPGGLNSGASASENLFLESRVRNLITGREGYVQSKILLESGNVYPSAPFVFERVAFYDSTLSTEPSSYSVSASKSYSVDPAVSSWFLDGSVALIQADLGSDSAGEHLRTDELISFGTNSAGVPRRLASSARVSHAHLLLSEDVSGGTDSIRRLRIRFLPQSLTGFQFLLQDSLNNWPSPGSTASFSCGTSVTVSFYVKYLGLTLDIFQESLNFSSSSSSYSHIFSLRSVETSSWSHTPSWSITCLPSTGSTGTL